MNRRKAIEWLLQELPELVTGGIIEREAADRLARHYGRQRGSQRNVVVVAIAVLGSLLVGTGIILLLAHNWEQLSRFARTVVAFVPLIIAQGLVGWTLWKRSESLAWREGSATLLTLSLGVTLAIVDQTYHTGNDLSGYLLRWLLLASPLPWLLRSTSTAALYMAGVTSWSVATISIGSIPFWFWLLCLPVVPVFLHLGEQHRSSLRLVNLLWVTAGCLCVVTGVWLAELDADPKLWLVVYCAVLAAMVAIQHWLQPDGASWWRTPLATVGTLGISGTFLVFSFADPWEIMTDAWWQGASQSVEADIVLFMTVAALSVALLWWAIRNQTGFAAPPTPRPCSRPCTTGLVKQVLIAAPLLAALVCPIVGSTGEPWLGVIAFNLFLIALGISALRSGISQQRLGTINGGMLVLATLITARFFDSELSLVVRGTAFIIVGLGFLVANLVLARRFSAAERRAS
jgi:uncharacterized membrane protein